jgi:hypothetical protein
MVVLIRVRKKNTHYYIYNKHKKLTVSDECAVSLARQVAKEEAPTADGADRGFLSFEGCRKENRFSQGTAAER